MNVREEVEEAFLARFDESPPIVVRAPGRVNLIGEHTDYNDGFVLPIAIDREIHIALRPRADGRVSIHSLDYDEPADFHLAEIDHSGEDWTEYVKGMAWALQEAGHTLTGWEGVVGGDVPRGAGLSSSAAIELATARAFAQVSGVAWNPSEMALLGQRVENHWIGVNSGIMDQMVVAAGREGHALLIDCRSLCLEPTPLPAGAAVVILDTGTRRGLVDSAYNERRGQCEEAARFFGVPALRDVDYASFETGAQGLDETTRRRARHVISENERTLQAVEVMQSADLEGLGALMNASHASLRDDFEVTNDALDSIVAIAQHEEGCYGARMTGAGFGGCAVALVASDRVERFVQRVTERYAGEMSLQASCYVCRASDGASVERADPG